jgi:uncharacterized damage-inducible protein DinB
MNREIQSIISGLQEVLSGGPWYGKSFSALTSEISGEKIYHKPNENAHSLADLLYHMITWAQFTQYRLERKEQDMQEVEDMDWRKIDPAVHTWEKGIAEFTGSFHAIIALLKDKDDTLLEEKVDYREYNFRSLLNGIIQHTIYHLGQIAYVNKLLA